MQGLGRGCVILLLLLCGLLPVGASAQSGSAFHRALHDGGTLVQRFPRDQIDIFSAPVRAKHEKHGWADALPFVVAAGLVPLDRHLESRLPSGHGGASQTISDVGAFGTAGAAGALYVFGLVRHDDHAHETGLLAAESLLDTLLPRAAMSFVLGRYRPFQGNGEELGEGDFFQHHGWSSSFPSGHAAYTWSMATVIAHEYPSTRSKLIWYGVGAAVSITRVTARQHFPSDVIAGSALGYLIARHVFHAHHDAAFASGQ